MKTLANPNHHMKSLQGRLLDHAIAIHGGVKRTETQILFINSTSELCCSFYIFAQEETCALQTHRSLETTTSKQNNHLLHYTPTLRFVQIAINIKHPTLPEQHFI
jgi:hypothetical protein